MHLIEQNGYSKQKQLFCGQKTVGSAKGSGGAVSERATRPRTTERASTERWRSTAALMPSRENSEIIKEGGDEEGTSGGSSSAGKGGKSWESQQGGRKIGQSVWRKALRRGVRYRMGYREGRINVSREVFRCRRGVKKTSIPADRTSGG